MARPIKDTPVLRGKDAENFLLNMDNLSPVSTEEKERAFCAYQAAKRNSPNCSLFR